MGLISWIFRREKPFLGYWIMIDFTDSARDNAVGNNCVKCMKHYYNRVELLQKRESYTPSKERIYKRNGYNVIDNTIGQQIPKDSLVVPKVQEIMGSIDIKKPYTE